LADRTYLLQYVDHDLRSVVDGEHNVLDTGSGQRLDLMQDHRAVAELDQWFGQGEGLSK